MKTLKNNMTKKEAVLITMPLSKTSKMPCKSYNLPASHCITGSKLREVKNSVCSDCYACKGCFSFSNVHATLEQRLTAIQDKKWSLAMVAMIGNDKYFRWHSSGDIQSLKHLNNIFDICENTPDTLHWLPTKEKQFLKQITKKRAIPSNLIIRYSMPMIDDMPKNQIEGVLTSTSVSSKDNASGVICKAPDNDGKCGDCRACWSIDVSNVSYLMH